MTPIVLVSAAPARLAPFTESLQSAAGSPVRLAGAADAALQAAREHPPVLMVVDASLDRPALELLREVMSVNALINTAVISSLPESDFHEAFEGLGVLAHLPDPPDAAAAEALWQRLVDIGAVFPPG